MLSFSGTVCRRSKPPSAAAEASMVCAGYDVWAKVIVSLADIGYDSSTMAALPYDWRLSIPNLELRDGYFTRIRSQVSTAAANSYAWCP